MECDPKICTTLPADELEWDSRDAMLFSGNHSDDLLAAAFAADPLNINAMTYEDPTEANLMYIAFTLTEQERDSLMDQIAEYLETGWWQGADYAGEDDDGNPEYQPSAVKFMHEYRQGAKRGGFTAEFVHAYVNDIAGELRVGRGWCPHNPTDKHAFNDWPQGAVRDEMHA